MALPLNATSTSTTTRLLPSPLIVHHHDHNQIHHYANASVKTTIPPLSLLQPMLCYWVSFCSPFQGKALGQMFLDFKIKNVPDILPSIIEPSLWREETVRATSRVTYSATLGRETCHSSRWFTDVNRKSLFRHCNQCACVDLFDTEVADVRKGCFPFVLFFETGYNSK